MAFIPPGILIVLDNFVFIQIFTLFSQIDLDDWDGFKNSILHIPSPPPAKKPSIML